MWGVCERLRCGLVGYVVGECVCFVVVGAFEFGYLEVFASAVSHCVLPSVLCFVLFVVVFGFVFTTSVGGVCCCLCLVFGLFLCVFLCVERVCMCVCE